MMGMIESPAGTPNKCDTVTWQSIRLVSSHLINILFSFLLCILFCIEFEKYKYYYRFFNKFSNIS